MFAPDTSSKTALDDDARPGEESEPPEPPNRARGSIVIMASRDAVFAVLSDADSYADWVVGAKEVVTVDDDFPARGAAFHPRVGVGPASAEATTAVVSVEPARHLELLATIEPLGQARIRFDLQDLGGSTLVTMQEEAVGDDTGAAGGRLTRALRARNSETMWRLKVLVERRAGSEVLGSSDNPDARVPELAGTVVARTFAWLSGLRNERIFHPRGMAFTADAELADDAVGVLADSARVRAIVRISRGIGVPHPLPDFNGIAVRLLDAHGDGLDQDVLLVSAVRLPLARHVLLPVPFLGMSGYSSILPYRTPDGIRLLGAEPLGIATIEQIADHLPVTVRLSMASPMGAWRPAAEVTLTAPLDDGSSDALRFDPWHTGADLVPAGFVNRLRLSAYAGSQGARRP